MSYVDPHAVCEEIAVPETKHAPGIEHWGSEASRFPTITLPLETVPTWIASRSCGVDAADRCDRVNLGRCKQKGIDPEWWEDGVHQLLMWIGTARQGQGAKRKRMQLKE